MSDKTCTRCLRTAPFSEFSTRIYKGQVKHYSPCFSCQREIDKERWIVRKDAHNAQRRDRRKNDPEARVQQLAANRLWASRNPEKCKRLHAKKIAAKPEKYADILKRADRKHHLKALYGLTLDQYHEMLEAQGGVCAICRTIPSEKRKTLVVDHDHVTGSVRKLLCTRCNSAIGFLWDSPDVVQRALDYLLAHK